MTNIVQNFEPTCLARDHYWPSCPAPDHYLPTCSAPDHYLFFAPRAVPSPFPSPVSFAPPSSMSAWH
eukprot:10660649-Alexandrium_andersonii.AAC.1